MRVVIFIFFICSIQLSIYGQNQQIFSQLETIIRLTLEKNPTIAAASARVKTSQGDFQSTQGEFNTNYSFNINQSLTKLPNTYDQREGLFGYNSTQSTTYDDFSYGIGLSKKLKYGTLIIPSFNINNYGKDVLYQNLSSINRTPLITNRSRVFLNLIQPLLLGFGKTYTTANIKIASIRLSEQENYYIYTVSEQLYYSLSTYLSYISSLNYLKIQTQFEEQYAHLLKDMTRLVELDAIPSGDILYLKAILANQQSYKLSAENNVKSVKFQLQATIGSTNQETNTILPLNDFPIDSLLAIYDSTYLETIVAQSLSQRQDILALDNRIESNKLAVKIARKTIQPRLDLNIGVGYNGIFESTSRTDPQSYFNPYFQNIPGMNYSIGVTMDIAPKFDYQRGQLVAATGILEQNENSKTALSNSISMNIKRYYNEMMYYKDIVKLTKDAVLLNQNAVNNELKKLKMGLSTIIYVMQTQTNFVSSLTSLNQALNSLNQAILAFRFHTGTLVSNLNDNLSINANNLFELPK